MIVGLCMLVSAVAGIYGILRPHKYHFGFFIVSMGILTTIIIALTIAIYFVHDKYHSAFKSLNCSIPNYQIIELMYQYRHASANLC